MAAAGSRRGDLDRLLEALRADPSPDELAGEGQAIDRAAVLHGGRPGELAGHRRRHAGTGVGVHAGELACRSASSLTQV